MSFNKNLKKLRQAHNISMGDMAEMLNVPYSTYQHYENKNTEPPYKTLIKIALIFDITVDELLNMDNEYLNIKKDHAFYYVLPQKDSKCFTPFFVACTLTPSDLLQSELQYIDNETLIKTLDHIHKQALTKAKGVYFDTYTNGVFSLCHSIHTQRVGDIHTPQKENTLKDILKKLSNKSNEDI